MNVCNVNALSRWDRHGHIEQMGTPEELYDEPATRFVAEFIGEANLIAGSIVAVNGDGAVRVRPPGGIDLAANAAIADLRQGDSAYVMVRPERIELAHARPSGLDVVEATVKRRVFSGEQMIFELAAPGGINLVCSKPSLPRYRALSPRRQRMGNPRGVPSPATDCGPSCPRSYGGEEG